MPDTMVLGAGGMLARAVCEFLSGQGVDFVSLTQAELDLTDSAGVHRAVGSGVSRVINCAAWTDVDAAETHEELATAVNGTAVGVLAAACAASNATLVHFSTDYVFSGQATEPYAVNAPRAPLGAYGRSKLVGEALLEASECRYYLLRTSWLYAPWGKNFVRTMARLTRERDTLRVVNDQIGRPSSASWIARVAWRLAADAPPGTYHVTDGGQCSWFEFAVAIAKALDRRCDIQPCTTQEFPRPAKRPPYSVLDIEATTRLLGPFPDWSDNLREVLKTL